MKATLIIPFDLDAEANMNQNADIIKWFSFNDANAVKTGEKKMVTHYFP